MVIKPADLKENILGNQNEAYANVTGQGKSSYDAGKNIDGIKDSFSHEDILDSKVQDITYSKKDKKSLAGSGNGNTACLDEVTEFIKTMQANLDKIVNQITTMNYHEARETYGLSDDTDLKGIVTVVERIQIKLAAADENYRNTGNLNMAEVKAVMGSTGAAYSIGSKLKEYNLPDTEDNIKAVEKAYEKLDSLSKVGNEQTKYLVENNLEPTIENVYKAQNSVNAKAPGSDGSFITQEAWEQLKPQVEQIISEAFPSLNGSADMNMQALQETARWMLENGVALNTENLQKFVQIDLIDIGQEDTLAQHFEDMFLAMAQGKAPEEADLTGEHFKGKYVEDVLISMQKEIEQNHRDAAEYIAAKIQLEEIRLLMTKEAGLSLLKRGIEIDTKELENLIEELKEQERRFYQSIGDIDKIEVSDGQIPLIRNTNNAIETLKYAHAAYIIGKVVRDEIGFTVRESYNASNEFISELGRTAQSEYEALMTRPDREYGDSIKKAFRNIGNLLEEIGFENTPENNRAARILSYNQMEISADNILAVVQKDREYQYLLRNLTPRAVLHCIRKGINPLNKDIEELNNDLREINKEIGPSKEEKFSEFLWKLDNAKEISKDEREAYIGIYRLINMVESSDGAAIGALINQNSQLTMNNLLTAARSLKKRGIDFKADVDLGFLENEIVQNSITNQLKIFADDTASEQYERFRQEEYRTFAKNEEALKIIFEEGEVPNFNNLRVAEQMLSENAGIFKNFSKYLKGKTDRLLEEFNDKDSEVAAIEEIRAETEEMITGLCESAENVSFEYLEELRKIYSGIKFIKSSAVRNESYQIPVELNGETTTIRLKIVRGSNDTGRVAIQFGHETMGKVRAEFKVRNSSVDGFFVSSNAEGIRILKNIQDGFLKDIEELGLTKGRMDYGISDHMNMQFAKNTENQTAEDEAISGRTLYGMAKTFLEHIKEAL